MKEQEIKEMAKLINDIDIPYNFGNLRLSMNGSEFLANQLFIKSYRKQSEVAKEIFIAFMEFYKLCQSAKEDITGVDIKNLARQYGVEL